MFEKNIYPYEGGNGFLVGKYFVTAGHCVEKSKPYVRINDKLIRLSNPLICLNDNNCDGFDIAIFEMDCEESPLRFSKIEIQKNDLLRCETYRLEYVVEKGQSIFERQEKVISHFISTQAHIYVDKDGDFREGNYFCFITEKSLMQGSSGSPIFRGNEVVGIMHGGNNDGTGNVATKEINELNFCVCLSSLSIYKLLEEKGLTKIINEIF